ncbi:MAG: peptide chain release factor N(5)-glutamine methyltransferase [Bacilli bacterium]
MKISDLYKLNSIKNQEVNYILKNLLNLTDRQISLNIDLTDKMIKQFLEAQKKVEDKVPLQYVVGNTNFYGYEFKVNPSVLIPRPETECLVQETIKRIKNFDNPVIADVATGSGCIAITLSKELNSLVYASDISSEALMIAKENNNINKANVNFYEGDMLTPYIDNKIRLNILVSNPPYISKTEKIEEAVYNNEPHLALFADFNGLEFYKKILKDAKKVLLDKYLMVFEIGSTQATDVLNMAKEYFPEAKMEVKKDLCGRNRMIFVYNY